MKTHNAVFIFFKAGADRVSICICTHFLYYDMFPEIDAALSIPFE